jgi:hypothetical protein
MFQIERYNVVFAPIPVSSSPTRLPPTSILLSTVPPFLLLLVELRNYNRTMPDYGKVSLDRSVCNKDLSIVRSIAGLDLLFPPCGCRWAQC